MRILYFAWLRQKTGIDSEEVEMPSHITAVAGLIEWLKERNENFAEALSDFESIRVAVNQEFASGTSRALHQAEDGAVWFGQRACLSYVG